MNRQTVLKATNIWKYFKHIFCHLSSNYMCIEESCDYIFDQDAL